MSLLLISGSLRNGSTNTALLRTAHAVDADTELFTGMGALPHFSPDDDGDDLPAAVRDLRAATGRAEALLVCTPEYAGALPGSFKNLLEWLVGGGEAYRKPIAWINVSGPAAPTGGADAHASLHKVVSYLRRWRRELHHRGGGSQRRPQRCWFRGGGGGSAQIARVSQHVSKWPDGVGSLNDHSVRKESPPPRAGTGTCRKTRANCAEPPAPRGPDASAGAPSAR